MGKLKKFKDLVHVGFEVGLLMKGIDGILKIIGGFLLVFLSPARLNGIMRILTQHELSEDPKDRVANFLLTYGHSFSISAQNFGVFYLFSHGVVKCVLIYLLWQKKLFAYPLSILSLLLFVAYQMYRYSINRSAFLIILSIFDIIMVWLTVLEYKKVRMQRKIRHMSS